MKNMENIKNKIIAVVGVSSNTEKFGYAIFRDLLKSGYKVFGINPKGGYILKQKIYPALQNLPQIPDMVIAVVPPDITCAIVDDCIKSGIKDIWMQPGSESIEAIEKAKNHGINLTFNACFMTANRLWK
ncbi:MAG: CoA-binding domain protein [Candidatus Roizmanbacteria bacterium GW2011_GWA2_36_23]|uniref:CoA-binding domain protein n=1 Tax=Candidatus Roizmanbacteria bacterium GW2011_GWA2_36_23 TaxID=1618480 RepID=A0A0G0E3Y2_9BACT|nr:MAG: CoA-binding domain protein [Candidatus Roizmanbacteria bacterium GW2011_GWA2_36_23]